MLAQINPPPSPWVLPDPLEAPDDAELIGIGADLEPATMLAGYASGIFPMGVELPDGTEQIGWWSPNPRGVLLPADFHVSRSLRRSRRDYSVSFNSAFSDVVANCADPRRPHGWIDADFKHAYQALHRDGWAHSVEVWDASGGLVGGLFGVQIGGLFAAESKFHIRTDASKVALWALCAELAATPVDPGESNSGARRLIDVQWATDHLRTLGVREVTRSEHHERLAAALPLRPADLDHPLAFEPFYRDSQRPKT